MHSQERELKKAIKLPTLMPWNSKCDDTKDGFDAVEMREGFQTTPYQTYPQATSPLLRELHSKMLYNR